MGVLCEAEVSKKSAFRRAVSRLALRASSFRPSVFSPIAASHLYAKGVAAVCRCAATAEPTYSTVAEREKRCAVEHCVRKGVVVGPKWREPPITVVRLR